MNPVAAAPLLIVLSAPSGAGKTTLANGLLAQDARIARAITCTTRAPRPGEQDGVDYYFLTLEIFERKVQAGEFLEHATVHGNRYGTLKAEVLGKFRAGQDVLLNIDVQGAASVRAEVEKNPELREALVTVFLTAPSVAVLEERLKKRAQDAPEVIQRRLAEAKRELARWREFQYLILSSTIEEDLRRMQAIVAAERLRQHRSRPPVVE
jgi:guanylate kinase